jgi:aspartate/methionine/tyrosine aminotransferase
VLSWADDEARALWDGLALSYTESPGHPLLRAEIARLYQGVARDEVIGFVPEEGIFAAVNCLVGPGDHVVCVYPGYQSLYEIAVACGAEVSRWTPREEEAWRFHPDDLAALVRPQTRLIVVNFPHNPTGAYPSRDDFLRIVDVARQAGAHLFCDEMYRFLEQNPDDRLPSACEIYDRAIVLFGMSKTYGLAGLRVGWLVTHDEELRGRLQGFKDWLTICGSAPSEILALIGLRNHERIVSRHLARITRNLDAVERFVRANRDVVGWVRPKAGSICFPRLLSGETSMALALRAVQQADIMVAPSEVFGYDEHHIRIGLGRESLPLVLDILQEHLRP